MLLKKYLETFWAAWQAREKISAQDKRTSEELAFLPAVLEIQESPPNPVARSIIWTIVLFFILALVWGYYGEIDIVAVAEGKIIAHGQDKIVQPLGSGMVTALYVREGQKVVQGEILVQLDSTINKAEEARLKLAYQNAHINRLMWESFSKALLERSKPKTLLQKSLYPEQSGKIHKLHNLQILEREEQTLTAYYQTYLARSESMTNEIIQRQAEYQATKEEVEKYHQILPIIIKRSQALKKLLRENLVSVEQYETLEEQRIEKQHNLLIAQQKVIELEAMIKASRQQLIAYQADTHVNALEQLQSSLQEEKSLENELVKVRKQAAQQRLKAPVSGIVHQLKIHTIGGVVTPAQPLMHIVPQNGNIEIEAWLENKDVGFVDRGQSAEIKVETFPFTKYGIINGHVEYLSMDAISNEDRGLLFLTKVLLEKDWIQVGNKQVKLQPGMNVTVEMKTGKRRVIEYFLAPLLRYQQESIRER